jgi:hypothetical protein
MGNVVTGIPHFIFMQIMPVMSPSKQCTCPGEPAAESRQTNKIAIFQSAFLKCFA